MLLPGHNDIYEFINESGDHIAVNDTRPYGERTVESDASKDLLGLETTGEDYTLFSVPESLLTLSALALGSGGRSAPMLSPTFEETGKMLRRQADRYKLEKPSLNNLAMIRQTGDLVFLPPFHFEKGATDLDEVSRHLIESIDTTLSPLFKESGIQMLAEAALRGLNNERQI